ncbi:hypothetical protein OEZ85_012236 [Tetradesmus obliquus]|uniref:Peptidase M43 pregnancy-associated plasma-A domain-containing protein n=1 Tax=Tetradesmus obliquus TaxID=3088 RepID=A0ABY8TSR0_TETOB|nr:hypothetical protein OEZ85_012236 [Tetradesmus obliquus]
MTATDHHDIQSTLSRLRLSSNRASQQQAGIMSIASVATPTSLTVDLYFHVISGDTANATVNAPVELLAQQLDVMNGAYGPFDIRFALKGVTRVQSEDWATTEINTGAETAMKARLRKGGATDLNIYIIRPTSGTLGWSTFPWEMAKLGQQFDGVVVHVGTLPGGTMAPYNQGYTMVHEVGHWLGLLHVFENGCSSIGDSVEDTAPQATAAYGCPLQRKTCPGNLKDPVTNYMGYTDDACMNGFTRGQADRILSMWGVYRGSHPQHSTYRPSPLLLQAPIMA